MPTQALSFATSAGYRWTMSELATLYDQRIAQGMREQNKESLMLKLQATLQTWKKTYENG